jgi:hypothetical protein
LAVLVAANVTPAINNSASATADVLEEAAVYHKAHVSKGTLMQSGIFVHTCDNDNCDASCNPCFPLQFDAGH